VLCSVLQYVEVCPVYLANNIILWHFPLKRLHSSFYGVAAIGRLHKIIVLFCKRALWKRRYSAKETYGYKEPTTCSHPIALQSIFETSVQFEYAPRNLSCSIWWIPGVELTAIHCNTLQYSCNALQYTPSCVRTYSHMRARMQFQWNLCTCCATTPCYVLCNKSSLSPQQICATDWPIVSWPHCVAVCCSVVQCVVVCCSVIQCVAVWSAIYLFFFFYSGKKLCDAIHDSVYRSVLQLYCSVLQCIAVCCSCIAVCCSCQVGPLSCKLNWGPNWGYLPLITRKTFAFQNMGPNLFFEAIFFAVVKK